MLNVYPRNYFADLYEFFLDGLCKEALSGKLKNRSQVPGSLDFHACKFSKIYWQNSYFQTLIELCECIPLDEWITLAIEILFLG